jgi:CTP:molybdopterin cytidylyltransferase MocA
VFGRSLFSALTELQGDEGARSLLTRSAAIVEELAVDGSAPIDVDGPAEYERALDALEPPGNGRGEGGDAGEG